MGKSPTQPTAIFTPFSGDVEVNLFGQQQIELDWSLRSLKCNEDMRTREGKTIYGRIRSVAHFSGVRNVYAPDSSLFNAELCVPEDFSVLANPDSSENNLELGAKIWRGVQADGLEVCLRDAVVFTSADCPTIIVRGQRTRRVFAAHAGFRSILDHTRITKEGKEVERPYLSVVDALVSALKDDMPHVEGFVTCGIGPENIIYPASHRKFGDDNCKILKYICGRWGYDCLTGYWPDGKIWLYKIIERQFTEYGVPLYSIAHDGIDTYSHKYINGDYKWWSSRRGETPEEKRKRNMVLVIRRR